MKRGSRRVLLVTDFIDDSALLSHRALLTARIIEGKTELQRSGYSSVDLK